MELVHRFHGETRTSCETLGGGRPEGLGVRRSSTGPGGPALVGGGWVDLHLVNDLERPIGVWATWPAGSSCCGAAFDLMVAGRTTIDTGSVPQTVIVTGSCTVDALRTTHAYALRIDGHRFVPRFPLVVREKLYVDDAHDMEIPFTPWGPTTVGGTRFGIGLTFVDAAVGTMWIGASERATIRVPDASDGSGRLPVPLTVVDPLHEPPATLARSGPHAVHLRCAMSRWTRAAGAIPRGPG